MPLAFHPISHQSPTGAAPYEKELLANGHGIVGDDPTNIQELTAGLVLQTMDLYVHRRKWSLTIHGLKGEAGEDEEVTRDAGVKPAKIIFVSLRLPQPILWLVTTSASRQAAAL